MPTIEINNTQLYFESLGKGPKLLLIAGLGSDSSSWAGVLGGLSEKFTVLTFDNPGTAGWYTSYPAGRILASGLRPRAGR